MAAVAETYIATCLYCSWTSSQARADSRYFAKKHQRNLASALLAHIREAHPDKLQAIAASQPKPLPLRHETKRQSVTALRRNNERYIEALSRIERDKHVSIEDLRNIARDALGKRRRYSWRRARPPLVSVDHRR